MENLLYIDELFCNTIEYFRKVDSESLLFDAHEGLNEIIQGKLKLNLKNVAYTAEKAQLGIRNNFMKGNLYCFYGLKSSEIKPTKSLRKLELDVSQINWGDTLIIILDTVEFRNRIDRELKKQGLDYKMKPIIYYDFDIYNGKLSIFNKRKEYEKQSEIRLYIKSIENRPFKFNIGNIEDIAFLLPKSEIEKLMYDYK